MAAQNTKDYITINSK